ncbi:MAG: sugar phosphate isomerase/epimerase family protein [Candidatus Limnocylindrales bacterium]
MKVALDPYMLRMRPLREVCRIASEIGYHYIELSPREDFLPFFVHPRIDHPRVRELRDALRETEIEVASLLPLYRWSSPDEDERLAAVRYWKRAIEVAVELECQTMNSEFSGRPDRAMASEAQFWKSMEELLPIFVREGITLHLEPHPDDFVEDGNVAVDLVRGINSPNVRYLYCAPHTFHMRQDMAAMIRYAAPVLAHVHVADSFNHRASSGLRYIVNPPESPARIHQHLDIGQGEVDWDVFFSSLRAIEFDGIATACVFAWEERAVESARFMLEEINRRLHAAEATTS